jgi:ABC-type amino acid transport system permease subunit
MTKQAAVIAIVIALMVGYYWARWRRAETTNRVAKAAAGTASGTVWRARGAILLVALAVYAIVDLWFRGRGGDCEGNGRKECVGR